MSARADAAGPLFPSTFSPGDLLAGRFRIVRFLARGAVGEVYEAEDLELRARVALKTIRPEIAADEQVIARFRREALLARQVTHPNVCRLFDVFHHRVSSAGGSEPDVAFLTMELLAGETLSERLRRAGRMSTTEALPLITQLSAALAAAHEAGIVHRDFKCSNVVLVRAEGRADRVVITDFGLARALAAVDSSSPSLTGSGGFVGSCAYMAPEQVKGEEVTPAADIYALGVVMYEMLTGVRPFTADSAVATALKRLNEAPETPRKHVPALDRRWEAVVLRCLERDPAARFASVREVAARLGAPASTERTRPASSASRLTRLAVVFAAGGMLISSRMIYERAPGLRTETRVASAASASRPSALHPRRSVALLGFKNLSGRADAAWLSVAFSQMLSTELGASDTLRTIPGENVARMKIELSLAETDSLAKDTLSLVRKNLGTDVVVLGSYLAVGDGPRRRIRLDLRIQDAAAGETIASAVELGTEAELLDLVARAGTRLRDKLGAGELSAFQADALQASRPSQPDALRLYAEGIARLRLMDALGARDLLERAVAADPGYASAHAALADAWAALGYDANESLEARKAFEVSSKLPRRERLWVEGRYREAAKHWEQAAQIYGQLWDFFPDQLDYGLKLAAAQTAGGRATAALATIATLRRLPPPAADDPRVEVQEAEAARALSDFTRSRAASVRAAEKGRNMGARLLVARARSEEGWALQNLGEQEQALAALEDSRRIYAEARDRRGMAWVLRNIGILLSEQGENVKARRMFDEALLVFREIGNKQGTAWTLNNVASLLWRQGRLKEARVLLEQSLAAFREIGDKAGVSRQMNNIAVVVQNQGDLTRASALFDEALAIRREVGEKRAVAVTLANIAEIRREWGQLAAAEATYGEALAINREIGRKTNVAQNLHDMAEVSFAADDLPTAKQRLEEALGIREQLGEKPFVAESRLALARLSLEEGSPGRAEALARAALEEFRAEKVLGDQAIAEVVLARALLDQGRTAEARDAAAGALRSARGAENQRVRLSVAIAAVRVRAHSGSVADLDAAVRGLETALAQAKREGRMGLGFEAQLARGEIEILGGRVGEGRARLQALQGEARAHGFALIARKAAASLVSASGTDR